MSKPTSRQRRGVTAGGRPYAANKQGKHNSISVGDFPAGENRKGKPYTEYTKTHEIKNGERVKVKATRGLGPDSKPMGRKIVSKGPTKPVVKNDKATVERIFGPKVKRGKK